MDFRTGIMVRKLVLACHSDGATRSGLMSEKKTVLIVPFQHLPDILFNSMMLLNIDDMNICSCSRFVITFNIPWQDKKVAYHPYSR